MFDIEYKGANAVKITTKKTTLIADPKLSLVKAKDVSVKGAVELATEPRFALTDDDIQLLVDGPGEYEVGDFAIRGIPAQRHIDTENDEKLATIYRLEVGDSRIGLIGNIDPKLSEDQFEGLGIVDILILPVGGNGYTLDATSAASIVRQVEPKVVIPIHYADAGLTYEVSQDSCDTFVKELGVPVEESAKLKVKSVGTLPPTLTVIKLARS